VFVSFLASLKSIFLVALGVTLSDKVGVEPDDNPVNIPLPYYTRVT
jgi:hypothetical protein